MKQHAKCTGCRALVTTKGNFECRLKFIINFTEHNGKAFSPRPAYACEKPKTFSALKKADYAKSLD